MNNLGLVEDRLGNRNLAYPLYRESIRILDQTDWKEHWIAVPQFRSHLAELCLRQGDMAAARELWTERAPHRTPRARRAVVSHDHDLRGELADLLRQEGRYDQAARQYEEAVAIARKVNGAADYGTLWLQLQYVHLDVERDRFALARDRIRKVLAVSEKGVKDQSIREIRLDFREWEGQMAFFENDVASGRAIYEKRRWASSASCLTGVARTAGWRIP